MASSGESASYFAIAECLANTIKHSGATRAWVRGRPVEGRLSFAVGDNGRGGAVPSDTGGLRGIARRLEAFDSTMVVASPSGGGTIVTFELPCGDLSTPNTGA